MRIINIVDNAHPVNAGIWKAAVSTSRILKQAFQVQSEIWYPEDGQPLDGQPFTNAEYDTVEAVPLPNTSLATLETVVKQRDISPINTIIVTHGAWRYPTRWGAQFKKWGYVWVYVPQGMLEPWSMQQKKIKKWLYFHVFEHRFTKYADSIRAVSLPESVNLRKLYPSVQLIPNGVEAQAGLSPKSIKYPISVFFMARLHHKKGIIPLVKAWLASPLYKHKRFRLNIAGPDDGELSALTHLLNECGPESNIQYLGAVYGDQKKRLLEESTYYILPSYSEGFPTSVLEAMQFGLIPLISDGCNFPELFDEQLGLKVSPLESDIQLTLSRLTDMSLDFMEDLSKANRAFVTKHYSLEKIASDQMNLYTRLLNG